MRLWVVQAVVRKDLMAALRSKGVVAPMLVIPVVLLVGLPLLTLLIPQLVNVPGSNLDDLTAVIERLPPALQREFEGLSAVQQMIKLSLVYIMAPLYLLIPVMVSSVIAADAFAGEKERGTLEALLHSPTTDGELYVAKVLSPWLAALGVGWLSFGLYCLVGNGVNLVMMGKLLFPNWLWLALAFWLGPAVAGLGLGVMVLVSARASSFQEAFQLGGVVVLPVMALALGQVTGVLAFSLRLVLLLGFLLWVLNGLLLWWGSRSFKRDRVLSRL